MILNVASVKGEVGEKPHGGFHGTEEAMRDVFRQVDEPLGTAAKERENVASQMKLWQSLLSSRRPARSRLAHEWRGRCVTEKNGTLKNAK